MTKFAPRQDPGLSAALDAARGVQGLASLIGVTKMAVSQWRRVPAERVRVVSAKTKVPDYVLRPDLYLPPQEKASA